ncbi:MAG: hypothetical protein LQ352_006959 [Teloschistes flavicans]|nr:MAG: hypothetical protein LQ352_006959 [Teloschistes flavicans]
MQQIVKQFLLAILGFLLLLTLSEAFPGAIEKETTYPPHRIIQRSRHLPRNDEPLLGADWQIRTVENNAAYVPHEEAAVALTAFYTSLRDVALHPLHSPEHWFRHSIGRLQITFHALGIEMDWSYIIRMVFRHQSLGLVITVIMTIGELPPEGSGCSALDEQVEVNQSEAHEHQCTQIHAGQAVDIGQMVKQEYKRCKLYGLCTDELLIALRYMVIAGPFNKF